MIDKTKINKVIISLLISSLITLLILPRYLNTPFFFDANQFKKDSANIFSTVGNIIPKIEIGFNTEKNNQGFFGGLASSLFLNPHPVSDTGNNMNEPTVIPTLPEQIPPPAGPSAEIIPTEPPIPTIVDTIAPTNIPKSTKAPDVFPIDPSLARPGTTSDEVFSIASEKTCVPKEVLKGIAYIESGKFFDVVSPKYFLLYNSYNWWKSEYLTDVKRACGGYDYASNTGIIPQDSNFAGQSCGSGQGGDLVTMGPMSVSDYWEGKFKPAAAKALGVSQVDQRVILDALAIVGVSIKTNVKPANCGSWTAWEVAKAACSYYGSCGFKDGTYYCNTFCRNYKSFGGKADCQGAVNKMQDNCWQ